MAVVELKMFFQFEPRRAKSNTVGFEVRGIKDISGISFFAEFDDYVMGSVAFKSHQEGACSWMNDLGVIEEFRSLLARLYLPKVCVRDRYLEILDAIVIAKPKVLSPSVFIVVGKDRIEEENDAVSRQPRQIALGGFGSNRSPVQR